MSTAMTVGIIVFDGVLTSEVVAPAEVFATAAGQSWGAGIRVRLIGVDPQQQQIRTEEGLRLGVDATIADDLFCDVLLVPGANDMAPLIDNAALRAYIERHHQGGQWLGSVCAGAFLLGASGALDGKQATTWFGGEARLQERYPAAQVVIDQPVVFDRRLVTANGGLVSYSAALALLGRLAGAERAHEVYEALGLDRMLGWDALSQAIAQPEAAERAAR